MRALLTRRAPGGGRGRDDRAAAQRPDRARPPAVRRRRPGRGRDRRRRAHPGRVGCADRRMTHSASARLHPPQEPEVRLLRRDAGLSEYAVIQTQFRDPAVLAAALTDLGFPAWAIEWHEEPALPARPDDRGAGVCPSGDPRTARGAGRERPRVRPRAGWRVPRPRRDDGAADARLARSVRPGVARAARGGLRGAPARGAVPGEGLARDDHARTPDGVVELVAEG